MARDTHAIRVRANLWRLGPEFSGRHATCLAPKPPFLFRRTRAIHYTTWPSSPAPAIGSRPAYRPESKGTPPHPKSAASALARAEGWSSNKTGSGKAFARGSSNGKALGCASGSSFQPEIRAFAHVPMATLPDEGEEVSVLYSYVEADDQST